jgi:hypothetical protein
VRSSVKSSHAANDNLIDRTRTIWQPRLGRDLTREDARQIAENVTGFFAVLAEWSRAETPAPANDTDNPSISRPARCAVKDETVAEGLVGQKVGGGWTARCPGPGGRDGGGE